MLGPDFSRDCDETWQDVKSHGNCLPRHQCLHTQPVIPSLSQPQFHLTQEQSAMIQPELQLVPGNEHEVSHKKGCVDHIDNSNGLGQGEDVEVDEDDTFTTVSCRPGASAVAGVCSRDDDRSSTSAARAITTGAQDSANAALDAVIDEEADRNLELIEAKLSHSISTMISCSALPLSIGSVHILTKLTGNCLLAVCSPC